MDPRWRGLRRTRISLGAGGQGQWEVEGGQLQVTQDAGNHRPLRDSGNDPQGATAAKRAGRHIQIKDAAEQPSGSFDPGIAINGIG
jgi:hypothetical protein